MKQFASREERLAYQREANKRYRERHYQKELERCRANNERIRQRMKSDDQLYYKEIERNRDNNVRYRQDYPEKERVRRKRWLETHREEMREKSKEVTSFYQQLTKVEKVYVMVPGKTRPVWRTLYRDMQGHYFIVYLYTWRTVEKNPGGRWTAMTC